MNYQLRRQTLQEKLRRDRIDALLVSQPENRRYLSGYTGRDHTISESSGVLFVPARGQVVLLTDFRFRIQAEKETGLPVRLYTKGLIALLGELIRQTGVRRLAFESNYTLHSFSLKLAALADKRNIALVPVTGLVEKMRLIKSETEIETMRRSVRLNERLFAELHRDIDPSMSEIEFALTIETAMRRAGAESPSFNTIVAAGGNSALPHAVPGPQDLGRQRPITIDMGLVLDGYCSDMTRSFVIGEPDRRYLEIHRLVRRAQLAGMAAVRAGASCRDVDQAARKIIAAAGYGACFGHSLGHGVGLAVHEEPRVSSRCRKKLKPGMVITIEPGVYLPDWGGVRLENMVVVREDGCENLNSDTTWLDI